MNKIYQFVLENAAAGKLDKQIAARMIQLLKQEEAETLRDIAITGISVKLPKAENADEFWSVLENGLDCAGEFPLSRREDARRLFCGINRCEKEVEFDTGAFLDEIDRFDYSFFRVSPAEAQLMDPYQRLFLQAAWQALEDAGYSEKKLSGSKTGVYVGLSKDFDIDYKRIFEIEEAASGELSVPGNIRSVIAGRISFLLNLKGPSMLVDTACSSSLVAVHLACQAIRSGECETAVAGGVKVNLLPVKHKGRRDIGVESSDGRARTFDDSSDGTGIGEGVLAIFLKPLKKALADRDFLYAVIKGSAVNQDGSSIGITAPNSPAQRDVIQSAWKNAGIDPRTVAYIEAHGTGTTLGDPIEIEGIKSAFRDFTDRRQFCAVGSVKTNIGHLDNVSGLAGLVKAALCLKNKKIPPSLHFNKPNRRIPFEGSPVFVGSRAIDWKSNGYPRICGVSSFGLSGTNCHVVLEEAPQEERQERDSSPGRAEIFTLSAKSRESLEGLLASYRAMADEGLLGDIGDICFTANTCRSQFTYRLALYIKSTEDFKEKICLLRQGGLESIPEKGIYYGEHKPVGGGRGAKRDGELTEEQKGRLNQSAHLKIKALAQSREEACAEAAGELCGLFVKGADIEWEELYREGKRKKVRLPLYPFKKERCWVEIQKMPMPQNGGIYYAPDALLRESGGGITPAEGSGGIVLLGRASDSYTGTEIKLAEIWAGVFGMQRIDIFDSFYELGGDSIIAIKIINTINTRMSQKINIGDMLEFSTIERLAEHIDRESPADTPAAVRREENPSGENEYDVSYSQRRMWFLQKYDPQMTAYNQHSVYRLHLALDLDILDKALDVLIRRHPSLRTVFREANGAPRQVVLESLALKAEVIDLSLLEEKENALTEAVREQNRIPFDLAQPLVRVKVFKLDSESWCIYLNLHHIIIDGWSMDILNQDMISTYALLAGGSSVDAAPLQPGYADYVEMQAVWEKSEEFGRMERYWLTELSKPLPILHLPFDFARPRLQTFNGSNLRFLIDREHTAKLKERVKQSNVTLHMLLLSEYFLLLHKLTRDRDIIIGMPIAGRDSKEMEKIVGLFINTICIRVSFDKLETFGDLTGCVKDKCLNAYRNGKYPFELCVSKINPQRDLGRSPIFSTSFQFYENLTRGNDEISMFELSFYFSEIGDVIEARIEYNTGLFKRETIEKMKEYFLNILRSVEENPEIRLSEIDLLGWGEEKLSIISDIRKSQESIEIDLDLLQP